MLIYREDTVHQSQNNCFIMQAFSRSGTGGWKKQHVNSAQLSRQRSQLVVAPAVVVSVKED